MMASRKKPWSYYAVDLPGLSRRSAEEVLDWMRQQGLDLAGAGRVVDPFAFYISFYDEWSIRALRKAVYIALESRRLSSDEAALLQAIAADFSLWLEMIEPGD